MRRLMFILLVVGLAIIYFRSQENSAQDELYTWLQNSAQKAQIQAQQVLRPLVALVSEKPENVARVDLNDENLQSYDSEKLKKWVSVQGSSMNYSEHSTEQLEIRLRAQARTLTELQMVQLREIAESATQPVNERIFASYLLSLNESPAAVEQIFSAAMAELTDHGPSIPHSEAEIRNAQEMALRYMQIDALFERAQTDANARNKLKLLSEQSASESVRGYARRRLQELR